MKKGLHTGGKTLVYAILLLLGSGGSLVAQKTTFGDLIPAIYLPASIHPTDLLDCARYFQLADSVNQRVYTLTGMNPIPRYRCGNDSLSFNRRSIEESLNDISLGAVLIRMIIDRTGSPVCVKVYMKGGDNPGKQIEETFSKLVMTPSYLRGEPVPTECRYVYDFLAPKRSPDRRIID